MDRLKHRISFAKVWRGGQMCFMFYGITKQAASKVLSKMSSFYGKCQIEVENARITNGKCYQSIVATITEPHTNVLSEADWPMIITRFLQKDMPCEVTYFEDVNKFLNS